MAVTTDTAPVVSISVTINTLLLRSQRIYMVKNQRHDAKAMMQHQQDVVACVVFGLDSIRIGHSR